MVPYNSDTMKTPHSSISLGTKSNRMDGSSHTISYKGTFYIDGHGIIYDLVTHMVTL